MRNEQIIENFVNGETKGRTENLYIEGNKLFNYSTCIAQRIDDVIYVNETKYSKSTTTIQNRLKRELSNGTEQFMVLASDNIRQGTSDLSAYI